VLRSFLLPIYVTLIPGVGILLASVARYRADLGRLVVMSGWRSASWRWSQIVTGPLAPSLGVLTLPSAAATAL